jgi:hypothetical protein
MRRIFRIIDSICLTKHALFISLLLNETKLLNTHFVSAFCSKNIYTLGLSPKSELLDNYTTVYTFTLLFDTAVLRFTVMTYSLTIIYLLCSMLKCKKACFLIS